MKSISALVLISHLFVPSIESAPLPESQIDTATAYLMRYGYLDNVLDSNRITDVKVVNNAVADFQHFAGLEATGKLDNETVQLMKLPRCGVKDFVGTGNDFRSKRYAIQGSRWTIRNISYNISKYPSVLDKEEVDAEVARAFEIWSRNTDLTFVPTNGDARIDVRFEYGEHGDFDPFDGPGGTLAHAYFPGYGGDAHFDAAEQWTVKTYRGTNLFQAAAHEFGHSLGLSHSDVRASLMAPFYRGYDPAFELDIDDILAIQSLYGPKPLESRFSTDDKNESKEGSFEEPLLCKDFKFDTIFTAINRETYVFKGDEFWKLSKTGLAHGYPKKISNTWVGLPGNIDAAFTSANGKTYFFKGSQYWRFEGFNLEQGFPRSISVGFNGIPDNIDAALIWSGNGKLYFFKGDKFWRFDSTSRPPIRPTFPKPISNWQGIPDNIDAAFQFMGYTYFFKDGVYYRINDNEFGVDKGDPAYPRSTAYWWFGCKSSPKDTIMAWRRK